MASIIRAKVHDMSGSFRMLVPKEWRRSNGIESKDDLDVMVSHALIVLPPRKLTEEEINEIIRDVRELMPLRDMMERLRE